MAAFELFCQSFCFNAFQENTYLIADLESHSCAIIDPGMSGEAEWHHLFGIIEQKGLRVERILFTHCHVDHVLGAHYLTDAFPEASVCGPADDQRFLPSAQQQGLFFGMECDSPVPAIGVDLHEGDRFQLGRFQVEVIDCPGHSHHGLCYYVAEAKRLFTGDVLFMGSVGRSDFGTSMGCNGHLLLQGIATKLWTLPDDVKVFPGHGPATVLSFEKQYNPYVNI